MKQFQVTIPDHVVVVMDWLREYTSSEVLSSHKPPTEVGMWPTICITPEVRETRLEALPQHSALPDMQGRIVIEQSMGLIHSDHSTEQQSAFTYLFLPTSTQVQLTVTWTDFRLEGYAWKLFAGIVQRWPQTNSDYRDWQRTSAGRKAEAAGIWRNWWVTQAAPELRQKSLAMAQVRASEERWKQLGPYYQLMYNQELNAWRDLLQKAYRVLPDHKTETLDQVYEWLAEFELHGIAQEQKDALLAYLERQLQVASQQEDSVYEYRIEILQMRLALLLPTTCTSVAVNLEDLHAPSLATAGTNQVTRKIRVPKVMHTEEKSDVVSRDYTVEELMPLLENLKLMKQHYKHYNPVTAKEIIQALPKAWELHLEQGGHWGPGVIKTVYHLNATTIGRYLKAFKAIGVKSIDGIEIS